MSVQPVFLFFFISILWLMYFCPLLLPVSFQLAPWATQVIISMEWPSFTSWAVFSFPLCVECNLGPWSSGRSLCPYAHRWVSDAGRLPAIGCASHAWGPRRNILPLIGSVKLKHMQCLPIYPPHPVERMRGILPTSGLHQLPANLVIS